MANDFSYTRPYEEAHVTAALTAKAMLMITMLCDQAEQNKSYGELKHAKWGAEAEDATIKRYEELRDAITGKGGEA